MFGLNLFRKRPRKTRPVVLLIMDGWGLAPPSKGNAISLAKTPNFDYLLLHYPHTELIASGESVGLPANEVGNTEVGHLTIGAGRAILQDLKRINQSIEKGTFFENQAFLSAASHAKLNRSKLHIMGLIGSGNVHSSLEHLLALVKFCKKEEMENVFLHLFTDGRDSPPKEAQYIAEKIEDTLKATKVGQIASVMGRYYAMDRDRRWERTQKAYRALVLGEGRIANSVQEAILSSYSEGKTDEFIEPTLIKTKDSIVTIDDNDAVIFFNFRIDRPRQLTMAFTIPDFESLKTFDFGYDVELSKEVGNVSISSTFERQKVLKNLFFVSMTQYHKNIPVSAVAFMPEEVSKPLAQVICEYGKSQAHMSESEKERFVRYYFNGMREDPFAQEDDIIVSSPKVPTYDLKPEMSLPKLLAEFKKALRKDVYDFFVLNFANPDMVAHTGSLPATIKAIEYVDRGLGELVNEVLKVNGAIFITADHGNAEEMLTYPTHTFFFTTSSGSTNTDHSNNPVPFIAVDAKLYNNSKLLPKGSLADVAPTILKYLGMRPPDEMSGQDLLAGIYSEESLVKEGESKVLP